MSIKLRTSGGWKNLASVKLRTSGGWKNVARAYLRTSNGWKLIFGASTGGPEINAIPTISAGSWSVSSSIGRFVLTGTNGTWSYSGGGTITQTYQFQYSTNNSTWIDIGSSGSITNGQTKTLTIYQSDYVTDTQYYRFSVTAIANINNTSSTQNSNSTTVTIPYPTSLTNGRVDAFASGTGTLTPGAPTLSSSGGVNEFTLSWSGLTNTSSYVLDWTPTDTSPTSPQSYSGSANGSITPTKTVTTTTAVSAGITLYGIAGTGGSFSASWDLSAYANRYNVSYSINGGSTQNTTTTSNSISLGTGNSGDSITVLVTPYNTASGYSGTAFSGSGTIPAQTVPSPRYAFDNVSITPLGSVIPYTTGTNPTITNSGGTLSVSAGSWGNSPTQYRYVWQRIEPPSSATVTHTTSSTTDSYSPSYSINDTWGCTITASNSYGFSTTSYTPSYDFIYVPPPVPSGGSVTLTGTGAAGTIITATTTGWSDSPTSYSVGIYASIGTPSPGAIGTTLKTSNSPTSSNTVSYTITTGDATSPAYNFMAYATATNAGGTSTQVSSNMITSYIATPTPVPVPTPVPTPTPQPIPVPVPVAPTPQPVAPTPIPQPIPVPVPVAPAPSPVAPSPTPVSSSSRLCTSQNVVNGICSPGCSGRCSGGTGAVCSPYVAC